MPFSVERFAQLQSEIRRVLASTHLNDWERSFLRSMQQKLDRQGRHVSLSEKQYRLLMKLTRTTRTNTPGNGRRPAERRYSARRQSRRRRAWWSGSTALILVTCVLIYVLVSKGPERFPEYLGPLVEATSSQKVTGRVTHVRDGDTIEVSGVPIRFGSLDCAERGTKAGRRATTRMRELVKGQSLICFLTGRMSYDRYIGSCDLSDGRDLGSIMIKEGYCERFW